jgi:hypothetical protein
MAAEMHNGLDHDLSVDVWAYGILLYAVLSQRIPFGDVDCNTNVDVWIQSEVTQ